MTYEQYWDGDCEMVKHFRKAEELKRERENTFLWLQGAYFYEALLDASPVLNSASKKPKPRPYRDSPIPMTNAENKRRKETEKRKKIEDGKVAMRAMMAEVNRKFKKGGNEDG